jgi:ethanolamine transporter EutH
MHIYEKSWFCFNSLTGKLVLMFAIFCYFFYPYTKKNFVVVFQFLVMEQNGMAHLIETIKNDMASLKIIKDGMTRLLQGH